MRMQHDFIFGQLSRFLKTMGSEQQGQAAEVAADLTKILHSLSGSGPDSLHHRLALVIRLNSLYLQNPVTERILFKPLQRQLKQTSSNLAQRCQQQLLAPSVLPAEQSSRLSTALLLLESTLEDSCSTLSS